VLGLVLVALSLGASNFAASIGIGLGGVDRRTRIRVALVFGLFEAAMPLIGLGLGRTVSQQLGSTSHAIGAGLLIAVGVFTVVVGIRPQAGHPLSGVRLGRLLVSGLALSVDNLVVGFALGSLHVDFAVAAAVIAVVSVGMSLIGLEIGGRVSKAVERRSDLVGGLVLIAVGVAVGTGVLG
jgi:putative Mn2+ efflux pump MntP